MGHVENQMTAFEEFADAFRALPKDKRTAWVDAMCACGYSRDCLEFTASQMAGTPVGDWLRGALMARHVPTGGCAYRIRPACRTMPTPRRKAPLRLVFRTDQAILYSHRYANVLLRSFHQKLLAVR